MKREIGFEEYLQYVKGAPSELEFKLCSGTHGLFEELGKKASRSGLQECPTCTCGACMEPVEHAFFNEHHTVRLVLLDCLKKVLPPDPFENFVFGGNSNKTAFCKAKGRYVGKRRIKLLGQQNRCS